MAGSYSGFLGVVGGSIGSGQRALGITLAEGEYPRRVQITHTGGLITLNQQCDNGEVINVVLSNIAGSVRHTVASKVLYDQGSGWNPVADISIEWTDLTHAALAIGFDSAYCSMNNAETVTITTNFATTYTITWDPANGGATVVQTVYHGITPSYPYSNPTKASTAQYSYAFSGWSPSVVAATSNRTYTAQYTATLRSYTVTWKDWDGTTLATEIKAYGTIPSRTGPSRASTAQYNYTFAGWSPTPSAVTGNVVYTAVYNQTLRSYPITWMQDDGSLIDTTTVAYGTVPTHADPVKAPDVDFTYVFAGWSPSVVAVTGAATYTATYTAIPNHRTVGYYDGSEWVECIPYYYDGSGWVEVELYYYDGNSWVLCSQA